MFSPNNPNFYLEKPTVASISSWGFIGFTIVSIGEFDCAGLSQLSAL